MGVMSSEYVCAMQSRHLRPGVQPADLHPEPGPTADLARRHWLAGVAAALAGVCMPGQAGAAPADLPGRSPAPLGATVLCYHRFGPTATDSMMVRTALFEGHLRVIRELGCTVIPLATLVDYLLGRRNDLPPRAVVITADDGHITQFTEMRPVIERARLPVTLFIYPSAISNASYAMSWEQLRELHAGPYFEVAGHTYWHPNFKHERKLQTPADYAKFVHMQLVKSKAVLEQRLGAIRPYLAWPFGIYDQELMDAAAAAGYEAAFTLDAKFATRARPMQAQPRYLMVDSVSEAMLERLLKRNMNGSST